MNLFTLSGHFTARVAAVFAVIALLLTLSPFQQTSAAQTAVVPSGIIDANTQVDVCHNNNGASDYSLVQAKAEAIVTQSNAGHPPDASHGGDIIPPFQYDFGTASGTYPGRNWDSGEDTFKNNCNDPADVCPNDAGIQTDVNQCTPDACPNIDNHQATVPADKILVDGLCVDKPVPVLCTVEVVSNTNSYVVEKDSNALGLSFVHPAWNASIPGATWIWGDNPVVVSPNDETQTFRSRFGFVGTVTSAILYIASDNSHVATLNTDGAGTSTAEDNFRNSTQKQYTVTSLIDQGNNELNIAVTNKGPVNNPADNPAGVLYKLVIQGEVTTDSDCSVAYREPVDMCPNIPNNQETIPQGMVKNDSGDCVVPPPPVCTIGSNLLTNGSFENPVIGGSWEISTITDWLITKSADGSPTSGEIWKGLITPSDGLQNLELDANEPTQITQAVNTTVGATYELRFDFAARGGDVADNNVNALVNGGVVMNANSANNDWTTYTQTFVATTTSTNIAFRDIGTPNSTGSLIDDAVLCLVSNPPVDNEDDEDLYNVYGYVWHDDNRNENWDGINDEESGNEEDELAGWTVRITNGSTTLSTTTDETGYYYFNVPAGTWTITEELQGGWIHTTPESHVVVVGQVTFLQSLREIIIPTAHAQVPSYGEYNFGNDQRGGGGGGRSLSDDDDDNDGEVLGDSDDAEPEPLVLGEQVSAVPLGAADAGAGGTAPVAVDFFTLAPVAFIRRK